MENKEKNWFLICKKNMGYAAQAHCKKIKTVG